MKRVFKTLTLFTICLLLAVPAEAQRIGNNSHINISVNGKRVYQTKKNGYSLEVEIKGDIVLNEQDSEVVSISRGGHLEIKEKRSGTRRYVLIEGSGNGTPVYRYKLNGRNRNFDEVDRDWYENMLINVIRETGVGAEQRTARILKTSGVDGVLTEVGHIESSSSSTKYMMHLFDQAKLNERQLQRAAKIASNVPSSGDKSRLLKSAAPQFLASDEAMPYYFDAVEGIPSSGDKTRVLTSLVENELLNDRDSYLEAIRVAKRIPSSGDRSRFLIKAADQYIEEASDLYFEAVASIPSSGDKSRVLGKLVEMGVLKNQQSYDDAMAVAQTIPSSGDRSRFLIQASDSYYSGAREAYFEAVDSIPSSGDHSRVLINLAKSVDLDKASLRSYLRSAKIISSSGDKTRTLVAIADDVAGDDDLVEVYLETAETISSSGDYKRALSALMN